MILGTDHLLAAGATNTRAGPARLLDDRYIVGDPLRIVFAARLIWLAVTTTAGARLVASRRGPDWLAVDDIVVGQGGGGYAPDGLLEKL